MLRRRKWILSILTGLTAVVVVVGALTYRAAYAQSPTPTAPAASGQGQPPGPGHGRGGGPGAQYSDADLASALGITTEQLQAAYQTANSAALKEAVSKGLITQAQADQMASDASNANGRGHFFFGRPGDANGIDTNALLAKALNISADKLTTAMQTAINTALDAAVKAGTITQTQADEIKGRNALMNDSTFQSAMKTAFAAAVQQAVSSGVITQAQADAILQSQTGGFFGPGFGRGFGPGGPGPDGGPGNNGNSQTN